MLLNKPRCTGQLPFHQSPIKKYLVPDVICTIVGVPSFDRTEKHPAPAAEFSINFLTGSQSSQAPCRRYSSKTEALAPQDGHRTRSSCSREWVQLDCRTWAPARQNAGGGTSLIRSTRRPTHAVRLEKLCANYSFLGLTVPLLFQH